MSVPKIGLSMLYCLSEPFKKMTEHLKSAPTEYVELVDDGLHELDKRRTMTLLDMAMSYGLKYSVHAPFSDINIASPSDSMRKAMIKRLKKSLTFADQLEAYIWVFHPGIKTGISEFYPGMDWKQNLQTAKLLVRMAGSLGVQPAIENVPEPFPFLMKSVEDFQRFYDEFGDDLGMVLDVGHSNINKQTMLFVKNFAKRIAHMHISDNQGQFDQHLGVAQGTVDWKVFAEQVKRTGYKGAIIVESIFNAEESVAILRELFS